MPDHTIALPRASLAVLLLLGAGLHARAAQLTGAAQSSARLDSGTPPPPEQTCYDVVHYGLALAVDPSLHTISGTGTLRARVLRATKSILVDLDDAFAIVEVKQGARKLEFTREPGRIRVAGLPEFARVGSEFEIAVTYAGVPREAQRPPWDGGFTWAKTADGKPWIATSCQGEGADLWWPCKDQPDDEPESMDLFIGVPEPLVCASNGKLVDVQHDAARGRATYHWHVSNPINAYSVAIDIAPYEKIEGQYTSTTGEKFPLVYYVLPENLENGRKLFGEIQLDVAFFESVLGPYPFRADKCGVAETPHLGMEQQTITGYGNRYRGNPWGAQQGFDFLLHHEMSHEYWGLLVTARNWNDFWIHEGLGTYMQALYAEKLRGPQAYRQVMGEQRRGIANTGALAPREPHSSGEMYTTAVWEDSPGGDIYTKGSWVVHTLRWLLGDERFFRVLRRWAYPDAQLEQITDGRQCRFATTDELLAIAEKESGAKLGWFWELYLRQPKLPRLVAEKRGDVLRLAWETPKDLPFPMPVEVEVAGKRTRVEMQEGQGTLALGGAAEWKLDPDARILRESERKR